MKFLEKNSKFLSKKRFIFFGRKLLEGSLMSFVDWKVVWNGKFDVLKGPALCLVHLKTLFLDQLSFPMHMHGDFDILGSEHLGGSLSEAELDQLLRER